MTSETLVNTNNNQNALLSFANEIMIMPKDKHEERIRNRQKDLISGIVPKYKEEYKQRWQNDIMEFIKQIPPLSIVQQSFINDPLDFPIIDHKLNDTKEIRNKIDKANEKLQTFTCDHSKYDDRSIAYKVDLLKLKQSNNLKGIIDYYYKLAERSVHIPNEKYANYKQYQEYQNGTSLKDELKNVSDAVLAFNIEALEFNNKYKPVKCIRCEKMKKYYDFIIKDIERLRNEQKQKEDIEMQTLIKEATGYDDEAKCDKSNGSIISIVNNEFKDIKCFPLMTLVKAFKIKNHMMIKQEEVKDILEDTGKYKITNRHNKYFVNRL